MLSRHLAALLLRKLIAWYTIATDRIRYTCTIDCYIGISQRSVGAGVFTRYSSDHLYQQYGRYSSVGEIYLWRPPTINHTLCHLWCGQSLYHDTTPRSFGCPETILGKTFTTSKNGYAGDWWTDGHGSTGLEHQLFCLRRQILSTDSWWSDGVQPLHKHWPISTCWNGNTN